MPLGLCIRFAARRNLLPLELTILKKIYIFLSLLLSRNCITSNITVCCLVSRSFPRFSYGNLDDEELLESDGGDVHLLKPWQVTLTGIGSISSYIQNDTAPCGGIMVLDYFLVSLPA